MAEHESWLQTDAPAPHSSWLKRQLWLCFGRRPCAKDVAQEDQSGQCRFWSRQRIVVALLVLLALVIMGLLLLWNYKCIVVWHLCSEDDAYPGIPNFRDG